MRGQPPRGGRDSRHGMCDPASLCSALDRHICVSRGGVFRWVPPQNLPRFFRVRPQLVRPSVGGRSEPGTRSGNGRRGPMGVFGKLRRIELTQLLALHLWAIYTNIYWHMLVGCGCAVNCAISEFTEHRCDLRLRVERGSLGATAGAIGSSADMIADDLLPLWSHLVCACWGVVRGLRDTRAVLDSGWQGTALP